MLPDEGAKAGRLLVMQITSCLMSGWFEELVGEALPERRSLRGPDPIRGREDGQQ